MVEGANLKDCIKAIRGKTTVKIWAEGHGFNYQTVIKVLNGYAGKRQVGVSREIIEALEADGYLRDVA